MRLCSIQWRCWQRAMACFAAVLSWPHLSISRTISGCGTGRSATTKICSTAEAGASKGGAAAWIGTSGGNGTGRMTAGGPGAVFGPSKAGSKPVTRAISKKRPINLLPGLKTGSIEVQNVRLRGRRIISRIGCAVSAISAVSRQDKGVTALMALMAQSRIIIKPRTSARQGVRRCLSAFPRRPGCAATEGPAPAPPARWIGGAGRVHGCRFW
jgi:hypothetical protein